MDEDEVVHPGKCPDADKGAMTGNAKFYPCKETQVDREIINSEIETFHTPLEDPDPDQEVVLIVLSSLAVGLILGVGLAFMCFFIKFKYKKGDNSVSVPDRPDHVDI